jgi:hypothetical protein
MDGQTTIRPILFHQVPLVRLLHGRPTPP